MSVLCSCNSQGKRALLGKTEYQQKLNASYKDASKSPLKKKDLKDDKVLVNHEKIHLKQQAELLLIFFYIFYSLEWILKFLRHKNGYLAYKNLSFEREAYQNENNFNYIKNRKFWAFIKYF